MEDYPVYEGKIIVLLLPNRHTNACEAYLEHCQAIAGLDSVKEFRANYRAPNPIAELTSKSNSEDPWGIMAIDEIKGPAWETIAPFYGDMSVLGVYIVTEYLVRPLYTDRPCGEKSPELKRIALLTRPEGISHADAMAWWLEKHPHFCIRHHTGMAYYSQNHMSQIIGQDAPRVDGFASLAYWNEAALKYGHFSRADSCEKMLEDCSHFRSASNVVTVDEYILKCQPSWRNG